MAKKKKKTGQKTPAAAALSDEKVPIAWLRELMREFVREREWEKYHVPRNLTAGIVVEAGELMELFQWLTPEEAEARCRADPDFRRAVGEELCDVLMYCVSLANAMDISVVQTVAAKMEKNRRKYPADRVRGHYERALPKSGKGRPPNICGSVAVSPLFRQEL